MSLRRFAQTNHAGVTATSPRSSDSSVGSTPTTPTRPKAGPSTPRTRLVYPHSPLTSPSLSASTPFDWEAARARRPPPYASPLAARRRSMHPLPHAPVTKKAVRKKGIIEKITSIPSHIAFQIALFPNNVPLPTPRTSAWILGGSMHFVHFCVRVSMLRRIPESEMTWEDLYRQDERSSWFDWPLILSILLICAAIGNTLYLFTRTRMYQLNCARDPVASPHAKFVRREQEKPPVPRRSTLAIIWIVVKYLWRGFTLSMRFLLNMAPPKDREVASARFERVQQLEVWTPGELELMLFAVYSPVHACLWMAFNNSNWIIMGFLMMIVGVQTRTLTRSFEALVKDRAIISAEVLHEYDEKFVLPRVNPVRKDASVMTHEAEVVNPWE